MRFLIFLININLIFINDYSLIASSKVKSIPIIESNEKIIDLRETKDILYDISDPNMINTEYTYIRESVYKKLLTADKIAMEYGFRICLFEGLRDIKRQKILFENAYNRLKSENPTFSDKEIFDETCKIVSPVINFDGSINIPPHSTGGAIDICLVDIITHEYVDQGVRPDEPFTVVTISKTDSELISEEAKKNRAILCKIMTSVGFINYPLEYWHWSYGDRLWAFCSGKDHAIYGSVIT
jgi:D-alanyl-D-alanine dipeptidase